MVVNRNQVKMRHLRKSYSTRNTLYQTIFLQIFDEVLQPIKRESKLPGQRVCRDGALLHDLEDSAPQLPVTPLPWLLFVTRFRFFDEQLGKLPAPGD